MSDRELLGLAAKAAGISGVADPVEATIFIRHEDDQYGVSVWMPLTDDGDALRLAIEVDITIDAPKDGKYVYAGGQGSFSEPVGTDKMAAVRRAIVRAAAEIGKAMP